MLLYLKLLYWVFLVGAFLIAPVFSIGAILVGWKGSLICSFIMMLLILAMALGAEKAYAWIFRAHSKVPKGFVRSLKLAIQPQSRPLPRLLIFPDPVPQALSIRALGGNGTILLSQGLAVILKEQELRTLFQLSEAQTRKTGIVFRTFCGLLNLLVLRCTSHSWKKLIFYKGSLTQEMESSLTPLRFFRFLMIYPFIQMLLLAGRSAQSLFQTEDIEKSQESLRCFKPALSSSAFALDFLSPIHSASKGN
jgi:hypothetical protein